MVGRRLGRKTARRGGVLAMLLLLLGSSSAAGAQSEMATSAARELAKQGLEAYDAGRFDEAAAKLLRAFRVVRLPTLALNAARALAKSGKLLKASELYLKAVQLEPSDDWQPVQLEAQKSAKKERRELLPRLSHLVISVKGANTDDIFVTVDSVVVPTALIGAEQMIDPGEHEILGKRGDEEVPVKLRLAEGEKKTATLEFEEGKATAAGSSSPRAPKPETATTGKSKPGDTQRLAGWIGIGVGGAGVVFGSVTGLMAGAKRSSLQDAGCDGVHCYEEQQSDVDAFNRLRTLSMVGFIVGGVGAATGVTLLLTASREGRPSYGLVLRPSTAELSGTF